VLGAAVDREGESPRPGAAARRPTRLLVVPAPVVAEGEGGRLTALRVEGRARAVLAFEGPERLRGEWWSSPFDRDYYRVRLDGLGECWVYRDGGDGRLYLHGFFD
jgi:protein ImuB